MGWQDMVGGLVNQVTGNKEGEGEGGGLLGSLLGSLGGDKQQLFGQLKDKLGESGVDVNSLLEKLGINPDEATDEDLEKLASHVPGDDAEASSDFSADDSVIEAPEEVAEEAEATDDSEPVADSVEETSEEEAATEPVPEEETPAEETED